MSSSQGGRGSSWVDVKNMRRAVPVSCETSILEMDVSALGCRGGGCGRALSICSSTLELSVKDKTHHSSFLPYKNPKHLNCFSATELLMGKKSVLWPLVPATSLARSSTCPPLLYSLEAKAATPLPEASLVSKIQILYEKAGENSPKYGSFIF